MSARSRKRPEARRLTQAELVAEARARFGDDPLSWAFECPRCGDVATPADFRAVGAAPESAGQECIGRHVGGLKGQPTKDSGQARAARGCDWAAYGLFRGPWIVEVPGKDGASREIPAFPLAEATSS